MLYPTLNQPLMMIILLVAGICSGILYDCFCVLSNILKKEPLVKHFFDFLAVIFSFILLFVLNLKFNLGQFRIYVLAIFLLGIIIERIFSKILWTKVIKKCYIESKSKRRKKIEKQ